MFRTLNHLTRPLLALAVLAALTFGVVGTLSAGDALKVGAAMPTSDAKLKNASGKKKIVLDTVKGEKGTMVIFTCNHCPYVKAWEGRLTALGNEYMNKGVGVIAINSNNPEKFAEDNFEGMQTRATKLGVKFPYVVDEGSTLAQAFGATRTPEVFLFDKAGKLVYHGAVDDNAEDVKAVGKTFLKDALEAVINDKPVPVAETPAVGCSIKFY